MLETHQHESKAYVNSWPCAWDANSVMVRWKNSKQVLQFSTSCCCLGPYMIFITFHRRTQVEPILAVHAPIWCSPLKENWRYQSENCNGYEQMILFTGIFFNHGWPDLVDGNQPMASAWNWMTFKVPSNLSISMTLLTWTKRYYQAHIYSYPWHFSDWTLPNQYLSKANRGSCSPTSWAWGILKAAWMHAPHWKASCFDPKSRFSIAAYAHLQWQCTFIKANDGKLIHFSALSKSLVRPIILSNYITHWQMNTWPSDISVCHL